MAALFMCFTQVRLVYYASYYKYRKGHEISKKKFCYPGRLFPICRVGIATTKFQTKPYHNVIHLSKSRTINFLIIIYDFYKSNGDY